MRFVTPSLSSPLLFSASLQKMRVLPDVYDRFGEEALNVSSSHPPPWLNLPSLSSANIKCVSSYYDSKASVFLFPLNFTQNRWKLVLPHRLQDWNPGGFPPIKGSPHFSSKQCLEYLIFLKKIKHKS
ncbi:hypothetical protein RND71_000056 [Anisodus tanguticus]|uniref:Uncharacterized protein n=1 Tax=Anisodus tanguticus TaxID=243964 RepID=A0AAE1SWM5_9SOLA|nr:hypothetical protein RND71_000056 [Anisodus tanguticus]